MTTGSASPDVLTHPSPNHSRRSCAVEAICVHWTGGTFASAVDWVCRDESDVSYHEIIGPDGEVAHCVAPDRSAWAVGASRAPAPFTFRGLGNSATYNIALAGGPPTPPTEAQRAALITRLTQAMHRFGFALTDGWRIVAHADLAVFKAPHPRAGQYGRKADCEGAGWLPLDPVRHALPAVTSLSSSDA